MDIQRIGFLETTNAVGSSATFNGTSRRAAINQIATTDTSYELTYSYFNAHFCLNEVGTCKIQGSNDNSTWFDATAGSANTASVGLSLQVPCTYKFYRAVFINGVTATTVQSITTSFII